MLQARLEATDSIISRMHRAASQYASFITEYRADIYIKAQLDLIRKNHGFRYIPGLFRTARDVNRYIMETHSDLHYTYPNIYDHKITAYTGTLREAREIPGITEYINLNVYSPYIVGRRLLSPLAPNSNKYYVYAIDSVSCDEEQRLEYHIRFIPRNKSFQLLDGRMVITEGAWSVREISFKGRSELLQFDCRIQMGEVGADDEYLPVSNRLEVTYAFAFNVVDGYYEAELTYSDIHNRRNTDVEKEYRTRGHNLTASYTLQCDRSAYTNDVTLFDSLRPYPLDSSEVAIYRKHAARIASQNAEKKDSTGNHKRERWGNIGDFFLTDTKWRLGDKSTLRNSPFLNPLMFSYSKSNGFSYRQDLKFNSIFRNEQSFRVHGRIGYNFRNSEFYWKLVNEYQYWPEHLGRLKIEVGNGNRIRNSNIIDELKKIPSDSVVDFDKLNLDVFKDLNFEISNHIEIVNGLELGVGFIFHRRTPTDAPEDGFRQIDLPDNVEAGLQANVRPKYNSFAPRIRLEWTPGRYYYMNRRQKHNLKSRFPTFILDFERGLKNVFHSTGKYERFEFDMQHQIRMGLLSNLYYRFGVGMFTNQEETYFADFVNFRKSNIPEDWDDEIGGTFQALDGQWYNASPYYVRAHITYEAPFLMMRHFLKYTNHIQNERLYLNALVMESLGPYFEVGYGIGTFVFDMGLFLSVEDFKDIGFGYKFTFELFSK